jgi:N-acetylglucosamine malate deacetylase 1
VKFDFQRIVVLSPHTDDGELGAGGTIARLIEEGMDVYLVVFSGCETSVPEGLAPDTLRKECQCSAKTMGLSPGKVIQLDYLVRTFPVHRQEILEDMIKLKKQINPDLVLVPSSNDVHQDHDVIYWEALRAFKKEASIWGYEHPWNNLTFATDIFVKLTPDHLEKKIRCLKEYRSQYDRSYMKETFIRALACTRGAQLDFNYAEAFELTRLIY